MKLAKKILNLTWLIFRILILVAVILVAIFVEAIDKMLPHQLITFAIPSLVIIGVILSSVLIKWRMKITTNKPKGRNLDDKIISYVHRHVVQTCVIIAAFFAVISLPWAISSHINRGLINDSLEHFLVIPTPAVSEERVNLTRVELEKSLREIGSYAKVSVTDPIKVYLYSNTSEFQVATGSPKSIYGLTRWTNQGPEIYIPAELPPNEKGILNEGAPVHELTHAIEALLTKDLKRMPLWINEGLANQYQAYWERVLTHIYVWLDRDKILSYERLSLYRYNYPQDELEKQFFYLSSYEFVRYLFMRYGESTIWGIIRAVGEGVSYESAISGTTGVNEKELYQDFLQRWMRNDIS